MTPEVFQTMVAGIAAFFAPLIQLWLVLLVGLSISFSIVLLFIFMLRKGLSAYL
jgi:hypothetical protein